MGWVINIVGHGSWGPDHPVGVPASCGLSRRKVVFRAQTSGAREACAVDRAFVPIGRERGVHAFQYVLLSARGPIQGIDVVAQQPGGWPEALRFRHLRAKFQASVLKAEEAL